MTKHRLSLLFCLVLLCTAAAAQSRFVVMHYNVENLFDCRHDTLKDDAEFLPEGGHHWTASRYWTKLRHIAQAIAAVGDGHLPDIVSLCEVENDTALHDLTRRSPLRAAAYNYVMTDSPDRRGVDVALLYRPGTFRPVCVQPLRVPSATIGAKPTRDILHVAGTLLTGDTLDVFVCHLPSRSGGQKASEPHRLLAAGVLRACVDSLCRVRSEARILIMGDFNDYPNDPSIVRVLQAAAPHGTLLPNQLYNLMAGKKRGANGARGTYRFRGEWGVLDHLIVNGRLLDDTQPVHTNYDACRIADLPFLTEPDEEFGGTRPFRTYMGPQYKGGYSDHLPVCITLQLSL